jgi:hypothetical protein
MPNPTELLSQIVGEPLTEARIETTCVACGQLQTLSRAYRIRPAPTQVVYLCLKGCGPILIFRPASELTKPPPPGSRLAST